MEDNPASVRGREDLKGVRQFGGVEGNVFKSCTGPSGCWGHLGDKETEEGPQASVGTPV
jgi:hypothetical protein